MLKPASSDPNRAAQLKRLEADPKDFGKATTPAEDKPEGWERSKGLKAPTPEEMTIEQARAELDARGIEYAPKARLKTLIALLEGGGDD